MQEHEHHVDDMQMRKTDESCWKMSQMSHAKQLHKSNAQINHTKWDDIMIKNGQS